MNVTVSLALCLGITAGLIALPACETIPDYAPRLDALEVELDARSDDLGTVNDSLLDARAKRDEQRALIASLVEQLKHMADATPEEVAAIEAQLTEAQIGLGTAASVISELKLLRVGVETSVASSKDRIRDLKYESAGQISGGVMEAILSVLGLLSAGGLAWASRAVSIVNKLKQGPSRAQEEVNELWDEGKAAAVKLAEIKAEFEARLALIEKGMGKPVFPDAGGPSDPT